MGVNKTAKYVMGAIVRLSQYLNSYFIFCFLSAFFKCGILSNITACSEDGVRNTSNTKISSIKIFNQVHLKDKNEFESAL